MMSSHTISDTNRPVCRVQEDNDLVVIDETKEWPQTRDISP